GQHGAAVAKVEPLRGARNSSLGRQNGDSADHIITFNRGTRAVAPDLTKPEGFAVAHRLAQRSDVIVEALRPGVMGKFGLSYEQVGNTNPDVIYLSVNGFGSTGPNSTLPVTDAVIQALSGLMTVNRSADGVPNRLAMIPVDVVT